VTREFVRQMPHRADWKDCALSVDEEVCVCVCVCRMESCERRDYDWMEVRARGGACANTLRVHASVCTWMPLSVSVGCLCQVRDCLLPNAQVACMRADVRASAQTKMAGEFKKLFAPYDWSLKDD